MTSNDDIAKNPWIFYDALTFFFQITLNFAKTNRFWSKTEKKIQFFDKKKFGQKNKILAHSKNFKSAEI
jgi:hypothetical protein